MIVREICARAIISRSKVYEFTLNAYSGCQHACTYCYARFMKRFTGHTEPWGQYVDVKINAPNLLRKEVKTKKPASVWISGVCDPYQPLEKKYQLTRQCLEILIQHGWPITIQTRSPLVTRDLDLFKGYAKIDVGLTITTGDDRIRRIFEPYAPPVQERVRALAELHSAGVKTFAMIASMLPGAEELVPLLAGKVERVVIDRMNYHYADWVYKRYNFQNFLTHDYFSRTGKEICANLEKRGIDCQVIC